MDLGLKGRKALISGGSQGIGLAIALALAAEGCNVAIGARGKERLDKAAAEIEAKGVTAAPVVADFSTEEGCGDFVAKSAEALGGVDILVNNVGGMVPGTLDTISAEMWHQLLNRNLLSYVHTTKHAIPHLKKSDCGSILNISGSSGRMLFPGALSTTLPNAAINGFSKQMASELGPHNITVNNLSPGMTLTESWGPKAEKMAEVRGISKDEVFAMFAGMSLLNRNANPEEIGWAAAFLVSARNRFMTGAIVDLDGGATRHF